MESTVDLHCHTNASDGSLSLPELHALARATGLAVMAVTDHDTLDAWAGYGRRLSQFTRPVILPGVELSTNVEGFNVSFHLVGLGIRASGVVEEKLHRLRHARHDRSERILQILETLDMPIPERVGRRILAQPVPSRGHIALAMVEAGHVRSVGEAFDRYLDRGGPAWVDRERLTLKDAIDLIHTDGGVAVLAHPIYYDMNEVELKAFLKEMKEAGLDGVEVYYSEYPPVFQRIMEELGHSVGLLPSGGSDFHGRIKPGILPGIGRGNLVIPRSIFDALYERMETIRLATAAG